MPKQIYGGEHPLKEIFSSQFDFLIPPYQRPYDWDAEQANELFDDLFEFFTEQPNENYFLGSIVLIKEEKVPRAEVIDGQQRLTTLTILLALLSQAVDTKHKDAFVKYILEPGDPLEDLEPKPRLTIREKDRDFFEKHIQKGDIGGLLAKDSQALDNDSRRKIQANANTLRDRIEASFKNDHAAVFQFGKFIVNQCYLVAVATPSQKSAFRVFSVMNNRGKDLKPIDIIKADLIGSLPETDQEEYTTLWEDLEAEVGRDQFNDLFSHIRTIYAKTKAKHDLLQEFNTHVLSKESDPGRFIGEVVKPLARSFVIATGASYQSIANNKPINDNLRWLGRIPQSDWIPPAISYLTKFRDHPTDVLWFTQKLERLAAYLLVTGKYVNARLARYAELLAELERDPGNAKLTSVELRNDEIEEFNGVLSGEIYTLSPPRRNYLILRTDCFLSDSLAEYDCKLLTLEHILPQTVKDNSQWAEWWPDERMRRFWVHRLANLAPLNRRRNSKASNYDFEKKKSAYFKGKDSVTSFIMTTQVLSHDNWDEAVVKHRQADLLGLLAVRWELK
ncbi:hypothetical protein Poly24_28510 [Rosistilla carotiformis]|uniref:DUF262 domain-containing protein n=1 Tax=Rosistilla carotiformis TaxID=2528017 RepID=A0A518JUB0_9BACT|nr:DUF262 domain-containing protein [Rosistilla carotiformis]QDV69137.1 hypothetical protein Poly24_28510 [Rosistilla carotiformis]